MNKDDKILILGPNGLVGSAVVRRLKDAGYSNLLTPNRLECNLADADSVAEYFYVNKPAYAFLCAAKVGGIHANNTYPVEFFQENIQIGMNVLESSYVNGVKKLMNLSSTCVFPKECDQPIKEEYLLTGPLEPTNEAYALAKIGISRLCEFYNRQHGICFLTANPTNIYGPKDNYHPENSHVLPAMIRKVIEAKQSQKPYIDVWGDGTPIRDFVYSEDVADALIFLMDTYDGSKGAINIGTGKGITINQAYDEIMEAFNYKVTKMHENSKPNGTPVKIADVTLLNELGFECKTSLKEGALKVYEDLEKSDFKWKER